jgi:maltooligosyltrehalose trehalohydrolase
LCGGAAYADGFTRDRIGDPQAESTFLASKLDWLEKEGDTHARVLRLYRELLRLRRRLSALNSGRHEATAVNGVVLLHRWGQDGTELLAAVALQADCRCILPSEGNLTWDVLLTTEIDRFAKNPRPPVVDLSAESSSIEFPAPGAVILGRAVPRGT